MNLKLNKETQAQVEENVIGSNNIVEEILKTPLLLLAIKDQELLRKIDEYLPYSIGMEFECHQKDTFDENNFKSIPDIMDVNVDQYEQRYRIPRGIKGIICLYNLSIQLKLNSKLDLFSSNHYHTDLTDCFSFLIHPDIKLENNNLIIEELKTWETALDLRGAVEGSWFKYNNLKTLEVRIGEPSFDYDVILKRIIQCSNIAKKLRNSIKVSIEIPKMELLNTKVLLEYMNKYANINDSDRINRLNEILNKSKAEDITESVKTKELPTDQIRKIIKNRTTKL